MIITIFGASGDLAQRKLFPSLSKTNPKQIIAYARSNLQDTFIQRLKEGYMYKDEFLSKINYIQGDYEDVNLSYTNSIFYLSVPPSTYIPLIKELQKYTGYIAIEKPFAKTYKDYKEIQKLEKPDLKFYLIDHYLLKPMCLAMNNIKKKIWHNDIESIFVIGKEELGVEGRNYFDATGIVKDIVQNHLMSLYSSFLGKINDDIQLDENERVAVLKETKYVKSKIGQYREYQDEIGHKSETETFAIVELYNKKAKCKVVLMAGKGLNEKRTKIRVIYKKEGYMNVINMLKKINNEECKNSGMIRLEDISKIELVLNLAPENNVKLNIEINNDETKTYIIMSKSEIKDHVGQKYGKMDDHALVFDCMLRNKYFPKTSVVEGELEWQIFSEINYSKVFYYEKGEEMPSEASKVLETIFE